MVDLKSPHPKGNQTKRAQVGRPRQPTAGIDHQLQGEGRANHSVEISAMTGSASLFAISQHQGGLPVASVVIGEMLKGTLANLFDQPTNVRLMVIQ